MKALHVEKLHNDKLWINHTLFITPRGQLLFGVGVTALLKRPCRYYCTQQSHHSCSYYWDYN